MYRASAAQYTIRYTYSSNIEKKKKKMIVRPIRIVHPSAPAEIMKRYFFRYTGGTTYLPADNKTIIVTIRIRIYYSSR